MRTRIEGAVCGTMWSAHQGWADLASSDARMPMVTGGYPVSFDLAEKRRRFTDHATIWETLESWLREYGGDFQAARFTADSTIIFEYRRPLPSGRGYSYHCREYELADCPSLEDLVDPDHYCHDFMGEEYA